RWPKPAGRLDHRQCGQALRHDDRRRQLRGRVRGDADQHRVEPNRSLQLLRAYPFAGLVLDDAGKLYGTTYNGGAAGLGTAFTINSATSLTVSETGKRTVTSSTGGINCPTACSANFAPGTQITLTATPASGWTFKGWDG